jgi:uncharacterized membrane protein YjdF
MESVIIDDGAKIAEDTQSDIMYALIGGGVALILLSRLHDKQLKRFD